MIQNESKKHWEQVYSTKKIEELGWYKPYLQTSFTWITELGLSADAPIIDVGGGASTLVDHLLEFGYRAITVLDLSEQALSLAETRLGKNAERVRWLDGDITSINLPPRHYELWHDRAVLHFLTKPEDQQKYYSSLLKTLMPEAYLMIGTFAPEAPPQCSGLPVQRYTQEQLGNLLGRKFKLERSQKELHITPNGTEQMYLYCLFHKVA